MLNPKGSRRSSISSEGKHEYLCAEGQPDDRPAQTLADPVGILVDVAAGRAELLLYAVGTHITYFFSAKYESQSVFNVFKFGGVLLDKSFTAEISEGFHIQHS